MSDSQDTVTNNRVTPEQIASLLDSAETQEHVFWGKELVVSFKLPSGFTICGRGACVDPANFNIEIGRKVAREDAENQLWQLEGYLLQNRLHEQGVL
ncbi:Gp49 family protein [Dendronalium sp. ChiSLP03b]|uniref:Gp49 family protein n=1 Tax=Dendronalium sp. ChiSLP03b TaxID=3075381 RepID=UPI00391D5A2B